MSLLPALTINGYLDDPLIAQGAVRKEMFSRRDVVDIVVQTLPLLLAPKPLEHGHDHLMLLPLHLSSCAC